MSKWSKFKNTPVLFFTDMIKKRLRGKSSKVQAPPNKSAVKSSSESSTKATSKTSKKVPAKTSKTPPGKTSVYFNEYMKYTHLLHSGEDATGLSHLDLWVPVFESSGVFFAVMVRNYELFQMLKEKYDYLTIIYAKGEKEVRHYLERMPFLKACFYPSNTGNNLHLLQFNNLMHIFIGHGDSDKTASAHKYFRVYDENWVAGEAHIDRFRNAGFDFTGLRQIKVGRPNLKEILEVSEISWRERFEGKLNLLYLSTWEGVYQEQNYTSVYKILDFFIQEKAFDNINIKLHPFLGKRDASLLTFPEKLHKVLTDNEINHTLYPKETPVDQLIRESNIFICDISAVVTECLAADAPIFVYIPSDKEIKLSQSKMTYEDYTYTFSSIEELIEKIEYVLSGNDYLKDNRKKAMEYILGKNETLNSCFLNRLNIIKG